ncbi:MAG: GNAT family N-acetyltransferase [Planctomycetota bacterium]
MPLLHSTTQTRSPRTADRGGAPDAPPDFELGELSFHLLRSVDELPEGLWDARMCDGHPVRSEAWFRALERSHPERETVYLLGTRAGEPVALAFVSCEPFDLAPVAAPWAVRPVAGVRRLVPGFLRMNLAMTGTVETGDRHWWRDPERVSAAELAEALDRAIDTAFPRARVVVVRDFHPLDPGSRAFEEELGRERYRRVEGWPAARITLRAGATQEQLFAALKRRPQKGVRRALEVAEREGLTFEHAPLTAAGMDELYPLYREVHARATELVVPIEPPDFFAEAARALGDDVQVTVARERGGRAVGFILTLFRTHYANPFLIGLDYDVSRRYELYRGLHWHTIGLALERGCHVIDLGVTGFVAKQNLGAGLLPMAMAVRLRPRLLQRLFGRFLPALLHMPYPERRDARRAGAAVLPEDDPCRSSSSTC